MLFTQRLLNMATTKNGLYAFVKLHWTTRDGIITPPSCVISERFCVMTSPGGIKEGPGLCHYSEGPFLTLIILLQSLNCPKPVCAFSLCTLLDWYTQNGRLRTVQTFTVLQRETFTCFCARLEKGRLYLLH